MYFFILLIARILQLNLSFVLKTQTEIEGFAHPVQLKANQKRRLPLSSTAPAFLVGFFELSLQKAELIFHLCSYISLFLQLPLRRRVLPTVTDTWCTETGKILKTS